MDDPQVRDLIREWTKKKWDGVRELPGGGQGRVFIVRGEAGRERRRQNEETYLTTVTRPGDRMQTAYATAAAYKAMAEDDPPELLAILKKLGKRESSSPEEIHARFLLEVEALDTFKSEPHLLKMLDYSKDGEWIVTEYHPGGTLANHRGRYRGRVRESLDALRPVIEAVSKLHTPIGLVPTLVEGSGPSRRPVPQRRPPLVHRDIKPENIFVGADGRLVLGDFGIVFRDREDRPTELLARVGSRDWIPPWANRLERIDNVTTTFDVYMLAKVLWWMVSGKDMPFWRHRRPENDIALLHPDEPWAEWVNGILDSCLVEDEEDCLKGEKERDARALLRMVDDLREKIRPLPLFVDPPDKIVPRRCRVCGRGTYEDLIKDEHQDDPMARALQRAGLALPITAQSCNTCGHIQLFRIAPVPRPAGSQ